MARALPMLLLFWCVTLGASEFTGLFKGSGRACYGTFALRARTVEWHAPFQACARSRHRVVGVRHAFPGSLAIEIEPSNTAQRCGVRRFVLEHEGVDPAIGWNLMALEAAPDAARHARGLQPLGDYASCYLYSVEDSISGRH